MKAPALSQIVVRRKEERVEHTLNFNNLGFWQDKCKISVFCFLQSCCEDSLLNVIVVSISLYFLMRENEKHKILYQQPKIVILK